MGTVTNSIGTSSRDYSTIALWEAALPASAVTAGNSYVGQCYNDAEFDFSTTKLTVGGTTTDATHTITLTTGTGQGFRDNGSAASNALRYNVSNGVAIKGNVGYDRLIDVTDNFVTFQNLQIKNTSAAGNSGGIQVTGTNFTLDSCIVQNVGAASSAFTLDLSGTSGAAQNCLIVNDSSVALSAVNWGTAGSLINCTITRPSNRTANGNGVRIQYTVTQTIQNCVIAGYGTAINKTGTGLSGSGNAIDTASYPSGVTGQTSLTIATEFENPSNASSVMDWRLKSTSVKCKDNGTNSGAPSTDIIGQAISNTTRDAGAWELQQVAASGGARIRQRWNRSVLAYPAGAVPGFDASHVAAKGISVGHGFSGVATAGGLFQELLRGSVISGPAQTPSINGRIGPSVTVGGSNLSSSQFVSQGNSTAADAGQTVAAIVVNKSNASNASVLWSTGPTAVSGNQGLTPYINGTSGDPLNQLRAYGSVNNVSSGFILTDGAPYFIAVSSQGTAGTIFVVKRLDTGEVKSSITTGVGIAAPTDGNYYIGHDVFTNIDNCRVPMAAVAFTPVALSLPELLQWAADPWSFWYPRQTINLFTDAPTPSVTTQYAAFSIPQHSLSQLVNRMVGY